MNSSPINIDFERIKNSSQPVVIDEETYWYYLEVLPPIYAKGCFGLGEPYNHNGKGEEITVWCCKREGSYLGFLGTQEEAEKVFAR